jgi:predicted MPP superfamily phosphohydrolase
MPIRFLFLPIMLVLLWLYSTRRLISILGLGATHQKRVKFILVLPALTFVGVQMAHRLLKLPLDGPVAQFLTYGVLPLTVWYAITLLMLIPWDLLITLPTRVIRKAQKTPINLSDRRRFLGRLSGSALMSFAGVATGIGVFTAAKGPLIKRISIPIGDRSQKLRGIKIAQISDLHVGPGITKNYVEDVVAKTNALEPDLIVLTGDLIEGSVTRLKEHISPLSKLISKHGVYFCTGNHEYYWDAPEWCAYLSQTFGITVLSNSSRLIEIQGSKILLAGVPDTSVIQFDPNESSSPRKALHDSPASDYKILLAHRPSSCFEAADAGFDLQLSGHTHGGQFFPMNFYVKLAHPYTQGLNRHDDRLWVYVNSGTGYFGPPVRFAVPSEITLLELT